VDPTFEMNDPIKTEFDWDLLLAQGREALDDPATCWNQSRQARALWYRLHRSVTLPPIKGKTRWLLRRNLDGRYLILTRSRTRAYILRKMFSQEKGLRYYDPQQVPNIIYLDELDDYRFSKTYEEIILLEAQRIFRHHEAKKIYRHLLDACAPESVFVQLG